MLKALWARAHHGYKTIDFPKGEPKLPERFRGVPAFDASKCAAGEKTCQRCADACPTQAITVKHGSGSKPVSFGIDLGRCLFCADCSDACAQGAISFSKDYRLATRHRNELLLENNGEVLKLAAKLNDKMLKLFGRSLKLRQVSAGGCNGCEADVNVLSTIVFDLGRFGIQFVASPRHADGLLITGPVTENMKLALKKTYDAIPDPKLVIAVGACAISGGPFRDHAQVSNGAEGIVPVDLYIPGCPPHPVTTLDALLRLLGKVEGRIELAETISHL